VIRSSLKEIRAVFTPARSVGCNWSSRKHYLYSHRASFRDLDGDGRSEHGQSRPYGHATSQRAGARLPGVKTNQGFSPAQNCTTRQLADGTSPAAWPRPASIIERLCSRMARFSFPATITQPVRSPAESFTALRPANRHHRQRENNTYVARRDSASKWAGVGRCW
jgi:hypothetical protein